MLQHMCAFWLCNRGLKSACCDAAPARTHFAIIFVRCCLPYCGRPLCGWGGDCCYCVVVKIKVYSKGRICGTLLSTEEACKMALELVGKKP